jgi:hypothetical protein
MLIKRLKVLLFAEPLQQSATLHTFLQVQELAQKEKPSNELMNFEHLNTYMSASTN